MIVYYRIVTVYGKYPFNQDIEDRYLEFSLSKRKWKTIEGLNMKTTVHPEERIMVVSEHLKSRVKLEKASDKRI